MYEILMLGRVVGTAANGTAARRVALALSSRVICPVSYRLNGGDPWGETVCERGEITGGADEPEWCSNCGMEWTRATRKQAACVHATVRP